MNRYKALIGAFEPRREINVIAENRSQAKCKIVHFLDAECDLEDREPPVGWTIELIDVKKWKNLRLK